MRLIMPDLGWQCLRLKIINKFGVTLLKEPAFKLFVPSPFISAFPKIWKKRCFPNVFSLPRSEHLTLHSAFRWHPYFQAIFFPVCFMKWMFREQRGAAGWTVDRVLPCKGRNPITAGVPTEERPSAISTAAFALSAWRDFIAVCHHRLSCVRQSVCTSRREWSWGLSWLSCSLFCLYANRPQEATSGPHGRPRDPGPCSGQLAGGPGEDAPGACDAFGGGRGGHTVSSISPTWFCSISHRIPLL